MSSPARAPRAAAAALLALLLVLAAASGGAATQFSFDLMLPGGEGYGSAILDDAAKTLKCEAQAARAGHTHPSTARRGARARGDLRARWQASPTGRRGSGWISFAPTFACLLACLLA